MDALLSFSTRKDATAVYVTEQFESFWLPRTLAERDAFWNQLRGMGIPERPSSSLGRALMAALPSLAVISLLLIPFWYAHSLPLRIFCALAYLLYMGRLQWKATRRQDSARSPARQLDFYVQLFTSSAIVLVSLLPIHHHRTGPSQPSNNRQVHYR